jgi:hypothetical protein
MTDFSKLPPGTKVSIEAVVRRPTTRGYNTSSWLLLSGGGVDFAVPMSQAPSCVKVISLPETPEQVEKRLKAELDRVTRERDAFEDTANFWKGKLEEERKANRRQSEKTASSTAISEAHGKLVADRALDRVVDDLAKSLLSYEGFRPILKTDFRSVGDVWKVGHGRKEQQRQTDFYKSYAEGYALRAQLADEGYTLHFGGKCPFDRETRVHYVMRNGVRSKNPSGERACDLRWPWARGGVFYDIERPADIIGYKEVK